MQPLGIGAGDPKATFQSLIDTAATECDGILHSCGQSQSHEGYFLHHFQSSVAATLAGPLAPFLSHVDANSDVTPRHPKKCFCTGAALNRDSPNNLACLHKLEHQPSLESCCVGSWDQMWNMFQQPPYPGLNTKLVLRQYCLKGEGDTHCSVLASRGLLALYQ